MTEDERASAQPGGIGASLPSPSKRRTDWPRVLAIFALALLLRLAWLIFARPEPVSDFAEYVNLGKSLLDHGQLGYPEPIATRLPGFPAFLALLMLVSRRLFWLSLWNALLSAGLAAVVYLLALDLSRGKRLYAAVAGLVCALHPTFIFFAPVLASEHLMSLLIYAGILLLLRSGSANGYRSVLGAASAGVLLGGAILTRGNSIIYYPAFLLALYTSRSDQRMRWLGMAIVVLVSLVLVAPWYLRNLKTFGPGIGLAATSGVNFYYAHNKHGYGYHNLWDSPDLKGLDFPEASRRGWEIGLEYIREDPAHVIRNLPHASATLYMPEPYGLRWSTTRALMMQGVDWLPETADLPCLPLFGQIEVWGFRVLLFLLPVAFLFLDLLPGASWILLTLLVVPNWFFFCVLFWPQFRYRFTAETAICMFAAVALTGGIQLIQQTRRRRARARSPGPAGA